jgi:hypothetical protein
MAASSEIAGILGTLTVVLVSVYAAYWAFEIRRALAGRLYRSQALGIGLVALIPSVVQIGLTGTYLNVLPGEFQYALPVVAALIIYYWTDASVRAARRSDPLSRDTLHWSRLRYVLLGVIIIALIYGSLNVSYDALNGITGFTTSTSFAPSSYFFIFIIAPIIIPLITGAVILPVAGLRSKDPVLRKHLQWFGFFALSLLTITIGLSILFYNPLQSLLVQDLGCVIGGMCLYKSDKSLAPINRLSMDEVPKTEPPPP